jgi:phospholipase/carboxylesterase
LIVTSGATVVPLNALLKGREPDPVDLSGVQVFLGNGVADPITTIDQARLVAAQLGERGADVEAREHPGGHQLPPGVLTQARDWFDRAKF